MCVYVPTLSSGFSHRSTEKVAHDYPTMQLHEYVCRAMWTWARRSSDQEKHYLKLRLLLGVFTHATGFPRLQNWMVLWAKPTVSWGQSNVSSHSTSPSKQALTLVLLLTVWLCFSGACQFLLHKIVCKDFIKSLFSILKFSLWILPASEGQPFNKLLGEAVTKVKSV